MSRGLYIFIFSSLILLGLVTFGLKNSVFADAPLTVDLSWPNCGAKFVDLTPSGVVGINNGLDHSKNPCLESQTQLFHNSYALYLNTGYPGVSYGIKFASYPNNCQLNNYLCIAYNYGYDNALYSIKYASEQNAHSFVWWLDVESDNSWTNSYQQNRQALLGMVAALDNSTFNPVVGFYSYPGQWASITNSWNNEYPGWLATGSSSKSVAINYCSDSFNGGRAWLTQYTKALDYNYSCLPNTIGNFKIRLSGKDNKFLLE